MMVTFFRFAGCFDVERLSGEVGPGLLGHICGDEVFVQVLLTMPSKAPHECVMPLASSLAPHHHDKLRLMLLYHLRPGSAVKSLEAGSHVCELGRGT